MTKTQHQDQLARTADLELSTLDRNELGESLTEFTAEAATRTEDSTAPVTTQYLSRRERREAERADEARIQAEALTQKWNLAAAEPTEPTEVAAEWDNEIPATFRSAWKPARRRSSLRRVSGSMLGVSLIAGTAVVGAGSAAFAAVSAPETAGTAVAAPTAPTAPIAPDAVETETPETAAPQAGSATVEPETSVTTIDPDALAGMAVEPKPVPEVEVASETPASTHSAVAPASASIVWPVGSDSGISSNFGPRSAPTAGASSYHEGVDFVPGAGTPVGSMAAGTVTNVDYGSTSYGIYVDVEHEINGETITTRYAHLQGADVSVGQSVSAGDTLGAVGNTGVSTGAHLHFEVHVGGSPVDPIAYLQANA